MYEKRDRQKERKRENRESDRQRHTQTCDKQLNQTYRKMERQRKCMNRETAEREGEREQRVRQTETNTIYNE